MNLLRICLTTYLKIGLTLAASLGLPLCLLVVVKRANGPSLTTLLLTLKALLFKIKGSEFTSQGLVLYLRGW